MTKQELEAALVLRRRLTRLENSLADIRATGGGEKVTGGRYKMIRSGPESVKIPKEKNHPISNSGWKRQRDFKGGENKAVPGT